MIVKLGSLKIVTLIIIIAPSIPKMEECSLPIYHRIFVRHKFSDHSFLFHVINALQASLLWPISHADGVEEPDPWCQTVPCPSPQVPSIRSICRCPLHRAADIYQMVPQREKGLPQVEKYLLNSNEPQIAFDELSLELIDQKQQWEYEVRSF